MQAGSRAGEGPKHASAVMVLWNAQLGGDLGDEPILPPLEDREKSQPGPRGTGLSRGSEGHP